MECRMRGLPQRETQLSLRKLEARHPRLLGCRCLRDALPRRLLDVAHAPPDRGPRPGSLSSVTSALRSRLCAPMSDEPRRGALVSARATRHRALRFGVDSPVATNNVAQRSLLRYGTDMPVATVQKVQALRVD